MPDPEQDPAGPTPAPTAPQVRPRKGCLRRLGWLLLLGLVLAVGAYGTRTWTLFPLLARLAERYVEARFDAELTVQGLDGDGWSSLSATRFELRAHFDSTTRLRHLGAREVTVDLSLASLLRGEEGWLRSVHAVALDAELDLTRPGSGDQGEGRVGPVPDVAIEQLTGSVVFGDGQRIDIGGGALSGRASPAGPRLSLIGVLAEARLVGKDEPYSGVIGAETVLGRDELHIPRASFEGAQARIAANDVRVPWESITTDALLSDARADLSIEVEGLLARLGATEPEQPSHLAAEVKLADGRLALINGSWSAAGGAITAETGDLTRDPAGVLRWSLAVDADVPHIAALSGLFGTAGWQGSLRGRTTAEGVGTEASFALDLAADQLELADVSIGSGTLAGSVQLDLRRPVAAIGRASVRGGPVWIAGREFHELTADAELTPDALILRDLLVTQPDNRLSSPDLLLPRSADPAELLAGARGSIEVTVGALESLAGPDAPEMPPHAFSASAEVADGQATLNEGRIEIAGGTLTAERGSLRLARQREEVVLDLGLSLDFPDLSPVGDLVGEPLTGGLTGTARVFGGLDKPEAVVDITGTNLVVREFDLTEFDAIAELKAGYVRFESLRAVSRHATLETRCDVAFDGERTTGTIEALRVARDSEELTLRDRTAFSFEKERYSIEPFVLGGSAGSLELTLSRDGDRWSADGVAVGLDLDRVLPDRGLGSAEGHVLLERVAGEDLLVVEAALSGWRVPGFEGLVDADLDLEQTGVDLTVRRFEIATTDGIRATFTGRAPLDWMSVASGAPIEALFADGELSFHATSDDLPLTRIAWPAPWDSIAYEGKGRIVADVEGSWQAPRGSIDVSVDGLRWTSPRDLPIGRMSAQLALLPDAVSATVSTDQPARFVATGTLRLGRALDPRAWIASGIDPLLGTPLELDLDIQSEDLAWLSVRVPGVRRAAGTVIAQLGITGSVSAPQFRGNVTTSGGELKLESDLPSLVGVTGELNLDGREIELRRFQGELGGAPIAAAGRITLPVGESPRLDLTFLGERLLLRRDPEVLMRADADLALTGTWNAPILSGSLDLRRSWLTKRLTLLDLQPGAKPAGARGIPLFSFREPPFRDMTLDLRVESSEAILLRGNVARGGLRPEVRIAGTGEVPRIEGTVALDPTTVLLPGASVEFRGGTLTFEPSDPFVPRLQLVGRTERFGHQITAVVTGPYDAPEVELSATPPLSPEEIVLILLAGRPPTGFTTGAVEATQNLAIFLAQDFASAWLEGDGDASFLERVEVLTGREVSRNGVPTIEIRLRVGDDFPVPGGRVYLSGERDVYEDSNLGLRFGFRLR